MRKARRKTTRVKPRFELNKLVWFLFVRLILGSALVGILFIVYLDKEVRNYISGNFQSEAVQIYARPFLLKSGSSYSLSELEKTLQRRGYKQVNKLQSAKEYLLKNNQMDIYVPTYDDGIIIQPKQALRLRFLNQRLTSITTHKTGATIPQFYLRPLQIDSLQFGAKKGREFVKLHQMPEHLIAALLTMEDRKFTAHKGIDVSAIGRAAISNFEHGKTTQGGSTITQQLVKNLFLTPAQTLSRKVMEALLAVIMELRFTKTEILELYLNEIFLGQSGNRAIHGFPSASEFFFGKSIQTLTLQESALLVGMVPAPSYYNPYRHPKRALSRRDLVLSTMASRSIISPTKAAQLSNLSLGLTAYKPLTTNEFSSFVDYMHRQLRQYYSEDVLRTSGLQLFTSVDVDIQHAAQQQLSRTLTELESKRDMPTGTLQGAAITIDTTNGQILALVGDRRKGDFGFNRAVDAHRPVGSLVKPAVYLTALNQNGYSLASKLNDRPFSLTTQDNQQWSPQNYDKEYRGDILLYQGLVNSYNVPTVRLGVEIGIENIIQTLYKLGIKRNIKPFPSLLLGATDHSVLEMGQVYQTIANQGKRNALRSLRSVKDKSNRTITKFSTRGKQVINQQDVYLIDYALKLTTREGTGRWLNTVFNPQLQIAGKTGTTNGFRDSWYAGYVDNMLTVVWVGRDDNQPAGLTGSAGAMRVWANMMSQLPLRVMSQPLDNNITMVEVDINSGEIANYRCDDKISLPFIVDTEPEKFAPCSGLAGKLANFIKKSKSQKTQKADLLQQRNK